MIKKLALFLFLACLTTAYTTTTVVEAISQDKFTLTQRFSLYAAIYLDQMPKPKEEFLTRFRTDDISDADFALIADNALLANLIEVIQEMSADELRADDIMSLLTQVLSSTSLDNEPSIKDRKEQIVAIVEQKLFVS